MGYIFESEIEQIKNVVRARTIGEGESITLRTLLLSRIHPAIKAYFKAEVERNLQQERQLESRSKKFPYSIPELVSLQHQEDLLLMVHYQFNQHEFDTLLDQAVHFTFNFLCRPQFTLVEFLFENQRHMSIASIEKKLSYCANYDYYAVLLRRYFADRGLTEISYEEFKSLLKKIDVEIVSRHSSRELAKMTKPIMGFVDAVRDGSEIKEPAKTLPINAAIVFFEDKDLTEIKLRLEYERDHNKVMEIDMMRLADLIEDVRSITSEQPVGRVVAEVETNDPTLAIGQPVNGSRERGTEGEAEIIKKDEVVQLDEEIAVPPASEVTMEPAAGGSAEPEAVNLSKISSLLSPSEERKILKVVFHKDKEEFQATLDALDRAGSWEEASLILDDLFLARDVSPQSKVAMMLTEKTYERYAAKKGRSH
jgi:hypothetical protein